MSEVPTRLPAAEVATQDAYRELIGTLIGRISQDLRTDTGGVRGFSRRNLVVIDLKIGACETQEAETQKARASGPSETAS